MKNDLNIEDILTEHRVPFSGKYNAYVNQCPECYPNVWFKTKDFTGYAQNNQGEIVEISECPKCFKKFWNHTSKDMYESWSLFQRLRKDKE